MGALLRTIGGLILGSLVGRLAGLSARLHSAPQTGFGLRKVARRGFVRNAVLGSVGVVLAEATIGTYLLFKANKTSPFGGEITVAAALVPDPGAAPLKMPTGKFWLANTDRGLIALYWKCVHLGCTVPWAGDEFRCPCHGSIYAPGGQYRCGPAPRSMDWFPIRVNADGSVVVDTGDERQRAQNEPADDIVVPYQF